MNRRQAQKEVATNCKEVAINCMKEITGNNWDKLTHVNLKWYDSSRYEGASVVFVDYIYNCCRGLEEFIIDNNTLEVLVKLGTLCGPENRLSIQDGELKCSKREG